MQTFTGYQYLMIDAANHFGMDKELFETRIQWVKDNMNQLEMLVDQADKPPLFLAAVMAIRDAQAGKPSGHLVGFDSCSSGLQFMAVMIGCEETAKNTGLVDPSVRADMYSTCTDTMNQLLIKEGISVAPERSEVKSAQMCHFYGSRAKPKEIFGEDTVELEKFYEAQYIVAPGAVDVMDTFLASWDRDARAHEWTLPDGFKARCKVKYAFDVEIEVDELDHAQFTHRFYENLSTNEYQAKIGEPVKDGLSNAANLTHSVDGMVVREMNRRCNYNPDQLKGALTFIERVLEERNCSQPMPIDRSKFMSLVHVETLDRLTVGGYTNDQLLQLKEVIEASLNHKPFPIICVHDEFKCHANNCNALRQTYIDILAELADSNILEDLLTQVFGEPVPIQKRSNSLSTLIRQSNYALS
ncbi:DNA-directed RNA polymerase [Marinobacterium litorale]|uniref:DNA-directed RNA polymerase n=1 Tax=Marinobacterium litorale TaxID=404770 RepID=UPI00047FF660|nr:DNA-directed RNA polymerase [Marinobacterium litorale]